jgi:hypothetical protein
VGFQPVIAKAAVGNEWDAETDGVLHLVEYNALYLFFFLWIYAEV